MMYPVEKKYLCREQRRLGTGWMRTLRDRIILRLEDHIASCPRCQRRLMKVRRVETALTLLLTQPLSPGLLQKANTRAISVLRRDLRRSPSAENLRTVEVRPDWTTRHRRVLDAAFGAAACLAVLVLLRIGIFSSMKEIEDDGRTAVQNYYAKHLDDEVMREIFQPPAGRA